MDPLISVIVPVYNVQKYLVECLESIVNQTYKKIEIVLIDDGSTDESGKICDEYAHKDCRIKVIHKKNGGLSDARNVGVDSCNGEYIGFVDSDDYIAVDMYEKMLRSAKVNDADVVACHMGIVKNGREYIGNIVADEIFTTKESMIKHFFIGGARTISPCVKLCKRNVMKDIRFPLGQNWEDAYIALEFIEKISKLIVIGDSLYFYRMRSGSIMHPQHWTDNVWDGIKTYQHIYNEIKNKYPDLCDIALCRLSWGYRVCIASAAFSKEWNSHRGEIEEKRKELRCMMKKMLRNSYISWSGKVDVILVSVLPVRIYAWVRKLLRDV